MTDQQRLDAAREKYAKAKANPNPGNLSVAYTELVALLWDLKDELVVKGECGRLRGSVWFHQHATLVVKEKGNG